MKSRYFEAMMAAGYEDAAALSLSLPDDMIPHSIIAFGYPADSTFEERNQLEPDKVHYEKW